MKNKKCFKCSKIKVIEEFYKHGGMKDGHLNKCKKCTIKDCSTGIHEFACKICSKIKKVTGSKLKTRKVCSVKCLRLWYRDENVYNFKGDKVGYDGLHRWVEVRLGRPKYCEICKSTKKKLYDWSNISGKYLRVLTDWQRLCRLCHAKFDMEKRVFIKIKCVVCPVVVKTKSRKRKFCSKKCSTRYYTLKRV